MLSVVVSPRYSAVRNRKTSELGSDAEVAAALDAVRHVATLGPDRGHNLKGEGFSQADRYDTTRGVLEHFVERDSYPVTTSELRAAMSLLLHAYDDLYDGTEEMTAHDHGSSGHRAAIAELVAAATNLRNELYLDILPTDHVTMLDSSLDGRRRALAAARQMSGRDA